MEQIHQLFSLEAERSAQLKKSLALISGPVAAPLFLSFIVCDWFYTPEHLAQFAIYRITTAAILAGMSIFVRKIESSNKIEWAASVITLAASFPISWMAIELGGTSSLYFSGLMLVLIGSLCFFPVKPVGRLRNIFLVLAPYIILNLSIYLSEWRPLLIQVFFISGMAILGFVFQSYSETLRQDSYHIRLKLHDELKNRQDVIARKSEEAAALIVATRQFSPQVVHSIRNGILKISGDVKRRNICTIFIDIENSTDRVIRLDSTKLDKSISLFMEHATRSLLKFDITIDNFLGDCVIGFSNSPFEQNNFVDRVLLAASDLQEKIDSHQSEYIEIWGDYFKLKMGIASGFASVGFYGREEYFRRYTAIGTVMIVAARLCSLAKGGEVLVSSDTKASAVDHHYSWVDHGLHRLKGMEADLIHVYRLGGLAAKSTTTAEPECPNGHGVLYFESNAQYIFVFKCRTCDFVLEEAV